MYLNCSNEVTAGTVGTPSKCGGPAVGTAAGPLVNNWPPVPWPPVAAVNRSKLVAKGLLWPVGDGPVSWKVRAGLSSSGAVAEAAWNCCPLACCCSCCRLTGCCCSCCRLTGCCKLLVDSCCWAGCRGRKENCCSEVTAPYTPQQHDTSWPVSQEKRRPAAFVYSLLVSDLCAYNGEM
jgi:hypothetical protein